MHIQINLALFIVLVGLATYLIIQIVNGLDKLVELIINFYRKNKFKPIKIDSRYINQFSDAANIESKTWEQIQRRYNINSKGRYRVDRTSGKLTRI
jgi:predicted PurR-regulated permease PerM